MSARLTTTEATLSGVIFHEEDLLFAKRKEELAHRIRTLLRRPLREALGFPTPRIGIDDDGDVKIRGKVGTLYACKSTTFFMTTERAVPELAEAAPVGLADITSRVFALRRGLEARGYGFRISIRLDCGTAEAPQLLKTSLLSTSDRLQCLLNPEARLVSLDLSASAREGARYVSCEYEGLPHELNFSYRLREEPGSRTFVEFVGGLELRKILDAQIGPALEGLVTDPEMKQPPARS